MKKNLSKVLSFLIVLVVGLLITTTAKAAPMTELTPESFNDLNPLIITGSPVAAELASPGGIVSRMLNFLFPLAGLVLFLLISWGGFEILISSADQKGMEAGKNRVSAAIIGFILLFSTYWMAQLVELIFRIKIL